MTGSASGVDRFSEASRIVSLSKGDGLHPGTRWRMTGSALRLEESRDGRRTRARRGKHLSSGGVQGGSGGGIGPWFSPGGSGKRAFRLRHPHQIEMLEAIV